MEPVTIIAAFGAIAAWLNLAVQQGSRSDEKRGAAIEALYRAAVATRSYVARVQPPRGHGKAPPDHQAEAELAQLWMTASIKLGEIDWDLAHKCEVKSGYWSEPQQWTPAQIQAAEIGLDTIIKHASALRTSSAS
jgi:hypothetical protein